MFDHAQYVPLVKTSHNLDARRLDTCCSSITVVTDCAVCAKGFAPGISYSCRECSRSITGSVVALGLVVFLLAAFLLYHLGSVAHDGAQEGMDMAPRSWKPKRWFCRVSSVKIVPRTAIKIVVTVWQIISQVCGCWRPHVITTVAGP